MNRTFRFLLSPPAPTAAFGRALRRADAANRARAWAEAESAYARALALDPLRDDVWGQYGHMLKEQGRLEEAAAAYRRAVALAPRSAEAHVNAGLSAKARGRTDEAIVAFREALGIDPGLRAIHAELDELGPSPPPGVPGPFADVDALPVRGRDGVPAPAAPVPMLDRLRAMPARLAPAPRRSPVMFFHLHKTAGLTLDDMIASRFPPARICPVKDDHLHLFRRDELDAFDLFSGHFDVGALRLIGRPVRTVSIFREPRDRLISFYRFHAGHDLGGRHAVNAFVQMANAMTAEAFFEDARVRQAPEVFNHYLAVFGLTYHQLRTSPPVAVGRVTVEGVARAVRRVRALDAIGLVERFEDSIALIAAGLALPLPRRVRPRNRSDALARRMKGRTVPKVTMTPRLEAALADLICFDSVIYAAARDEFDHRKAAYDSAGTSGGRRR